MCYSLSMFNMHELTKADIPLVHALSVEIFGVSAKDPKYAIERWEEHLSQHGLLLGAFDGDELVGFKFGYEREPGALHSWLGGVREPYRRRGIMRLLTEKQESWARNNGYHCVTVNTYKDKFPAMYQFLMGSGYHETEERLGKSFLRKEL